MLTPLEVAALSKTTHKQALPQRLTARATEDVPRRTQAALEHPPSKGKHNNTDETMDTGTDIKTVK